MYIQFVRSFIHEKGDEENPKNNEIEIKKGRPAIMAYFVSFHIKEEREGKKF
jgi:hypothetical protein